LITFRELERIEEEVADVCFNLLSRYMLEGSEGNHGKYEHE
jgi:hypothetical protein